MKWTGQGERERERKRERERERERESPFSEPFLAIVYACHIPYRMTTFITIILPRAKNP